MKNLAITYSVNSPAHLELALVIISESLLILNVFSFKIILSTFLNVGRACFIKRLIEWDTLRRECPYLEFFWSVFSRIRTEYGEIQSISPYSVQMQENTDQKNSEYGQFSRSDTFL